MTTSEKINALVDEGGFTYEEAAMFLVDSGEISLDDVLKDSEA